MHSEISGGYLERMSVRGSRDDLVYLGGWGVNGVIKESQIYEVTELSWVT